MGPSIFCVAPVLTFIVKAVQAYRSVRCRLRHIFKCRGAWCVTLVKHHTIITEFPPNLPGPGNCLGLLAGKSGPTAVRGQYYGLAAAIGKVGAFVGTWGMSRLFTLKVT